MKFTDPEITQRLEPGLEECPISLAVSLSCAISMKRIADFLAGSLHNEDAVQYAIRELNIRR